MGQRLTIALAGLLIGPLAGGAPAVAQDVDDWDYGEDAARKLAIAAVTFENFGVAVRCMEENLSVVLSGLPADSGQRRLMYGMDGEPESESLWVSGQDSTTAFAVWPRSVATALSRGGRLSVLAPEGASMRSYVVQLPASAGSVGRVFQACGRELDSSRPDDSPAKEDFAGLVWARSPEINYPRDARYEAGLAAILCHVEADGGLRDCSVESEFPEGSGFGRAATYGAHRTGRVEPAEGAGQDIEGRRIAFVTRYRMAPFGLTPAPSRLPPPDAIYNPPPAKAD
jgi:hypothetical protein